MNGDTSSPSELFGGLLGLMTAGGVVMILAGLAEHAIIRHKLWRSLHLSSSEAKRERKAVGGDRATRAVGFRRRLGEAKK